MSGETLYIAIGYLCNHACLFCPCGEDEARRGLTLSSEEMTGKIDAVMTERKIQHVTVSGGEPTIQPCFFAVMSKFAEYDVDIELLSNADTFSDSSLIDEISKVFPLNRLAVTTSIHSCDEQIHDMITHCAGSFLRSLSGLHHLMDAGVAINIKHILNRFSYRQLPSYVSWVLNEFPETHYLIVTGMDLSGMDETQKLEAAVSLREVEPFLDEALAVYENLRQNGSKVALRLCDLPLCVVDPLYWKYFKIKTSRTTDAYLAPENDQSAFVSFDVLDDCAPFYSQCSSCGLMHYCPGSWRTHCMWFGDMEAKPIEFYYQESIG